MAHAVSFALLDSVNLLLIGVILGLGVLLRRSYGRTVALLIAGDWLGVLILALATMAVFSGLGDAVRAVLGSPWYGGTLVAVGLVSIIIAGRTSPESTAAMADRILTPLRRPGSSTVLIGFLLGTVQSLTSLPFFAGIAELAAGGFDAGVRYAGMLVYASLALSLPTLSAVLVGLVRARPESPPARLFAVLRSHAAGLTRWAGYLVAAILILIGLLSLLHR